MSRPRLWKMRISVDFEPRYLWIGLEWQPHRDGFLIEVCPFPTLRIWVEFERPIQGSPTRYR